MRDNRGIGVVELIIIAALLAGIFTLVMHSRVGAAEFQDNLEKVKFTCYCPESCPGTVTASGVKVREGIMASNREHLGDCAMVYLTDGTFLGYYESLDVGGTEGIRKGDVIDVWVPSLPKANELMALTRGEVMITWIEQPQG